MPSALPPTKQPAAPSRPAPPPPVEIASKLNPATRKELSLPRRDGRTTTKKLSSGSTIDREGAARSKVRAMVDRFEQPATGKRDKSPARPAARTGTARAPEIVQVETGRAKGTDKGDVLDRGYSAAIAAYVRADDIASAVKDVTAKKTIVIRTAHDADYTKGMEVVMEKPRFNTNKENIDGIGKDNGTDISNYRHNVMPRARKDSGLSLHSAKVPSSPGSSSLTGCASGSSLDACPVGVPLAGISEPGISALGTSISQGSHAASLSMPSVYSQDGHEDELSDWERYEYTYGSDANYGGNEESPSKQKNCKIAVGTAQSQGKRDSPQHIGSGFESCNSDRVSGPYFPDQVPAKHGKDAAVAAATVTVAFSTLSDASTPTATLYLPATTGQSSVCWTADESSTSQPSIQSGKSSALLSTPTTSNTTTQSSCPLHSTTPSRSSHSAVSSPLLHDDGASPPPPAWMGTRTDSSGSNILLPICYDHTLEQDSLEVLRYRQFFHQPLGRCLDDGAPEPIGDGGTSDTCDLFDGLEPLAMPKASAKKKKNDKPSEAGEALSESALGRSSAADDGRYTHPRPMATPSMRGVATRRDPDKVHAF
ncbi:uncharacterized protein B0I36DRAFT_352013 [Microdochium trichocladiopsis]|uniref:Uncharacterized protein n=1 Tax=Microdochium trichocladiopsis TaxID=1682393 RepID=A0A9P8Y129_9PEZI|nr:uncharacterized protein B0I36DRAFT_352013 [Microdochium trichocladiopsis]KAH7026101.1 hypothetical protein B0I36DRAFT_352013 [Microdochium trichocladiopsis]